MKQRQSKFKKPKILILYTGGTFGMVETSAKSARSGSLQVPHWSAKEIKDYLKKMIPEMDHLADCTIVPLFNLDSSEIGAHHWLTLAERIRREGSRYQGVLVLHGTDTLSYTASALHFLVRPCPCPVILTGAQKPLSAIRTDARRNFLSSLEILASEIPELQRKRPRWAKNLNRILVFFDDALFAGEHVQKTHSLDFNAFESPHFPILMKTGVRNEFREGLEQLKPLPRLPRLERAFDLRILQIQVTPEIDLRPLEALYIAGIGTESRPFAGPALLVNLFGSGTAPLQSSGFLESMASLTKQGVPVVFSRNMPGSNSEKGLETYESGRKLALTGAAWGGGMTPEAVFVKMGLVLGQKQGWRRFKSIWNKL